MQWYRDDTIWVRGKDSIPFDTCFSYASWKISMDPSFSFIFLASAYNSIIPFSIKVRSFYTWRTSLSAKLELFMFFSQKLSIMILKNMWTNSWIITKSWIQSTISSFHGIFSLNYTLMVLVCEIYWTSSFSATSVIRNLSQSTGCPKKHRNSVTNWISSLLWISVVIPNFKPTILLCLLEFILWKR